MRQRKFRIWSIKENRIIFPDSIIFFSKQNGDAWSSYDVDVTQKFHDYSSYSGDKLMEWVGNKTKDKIDVYEGDKLLLDLSECGDNYTSWLSGQIGIVKYEAEQGGWIVECEYHKNRQYFIRLNCDIAFTSKIVGHIYEIK